MDDVDVRMYDVVRSKTTTTVQAVGNHAVICTSEASRWSCDNVCFCRAACLLFALFLKYLYNNGEPSHLLSMPIAKRDIQSPPTRI
jgi:hypothetical protein